MLTEGQRSLPNIKNEKNQEGEEGKKKYLKDAESYRSLSKYSAKWPPPPIAIKSMAHTVKYRFAPVH